VRGGHGGGGRWFAAYRRLRDVPRFGAERGEAGGASIGAARAPLLQQEVRRPDHRVGMKAVAHHAVMDDIGQSDQGHALMMGHVTAHDGDRLVFRESCRREIKRLEEAITAQGAQLFQAGVVAGGGVGLVHGGQGGGVGGDHQIFREAALQAQAGHAKRRILIGEFKIALVERRFRDAPGHALFPAIADLAFDHPAASLVKQAVARREADQRGHQVFEHRARPGQQRWAADGAGHAPAEVEPVLAAYIALGDGDQAGESRLGGEQVVIALVEHSGGGLETNGEQMALVIVEEAEVHLFEQPLCHPRDRFQAPGQCRRLRLARPVARMGAEVVAQQSGPFQRGIGPGVAALGGIGARQVQQVLGAHDQMFPCGVLRGGGREQRAELVRRPP